MADHTEFVELAIELITEEGRDISLVKLSSAASDPTKPWKGTGAPTPEWTNDVKAVFLPASGTELGSIVDSPELLASVEQVCLVAPLEGALLDQSTTVTDKGSTWKVVFCKVLQPADQVCLYVFGVKR